MKKPRRNREKDAQKQQSDNVALDSVKTDTVTSDSVKSDTATLNNVKTDNGTSGDLNLGNGDAGYVTMESPLQLFGEAKNKINDLYHKLDNCVHKASQFYSDPQLDAEILKSIDTARLGRLHKSIETIKGILSRNQMKVAFFGRTSNGKSTVINAILHDKVLPMGYGHTTGCFLQIQGNQEPEAYLEVQRNGQGEEKKPIQSVSHIANALNTDSLEYSTLVKIHWPISKCPLLKYDVVLVDSPGVDVEENLDEWIDEHCHDADVFVLVSNAESTLNIAEKNFFHKVSEKLSKPNIFILNNRWDSIADDPDSMDQVREQHIERAVSFLSQELKIATQDEARQRTFFVSARETLQLRCPKGAGLNESFRREGFDIRCREFENFEKRFEESLSKSAVKTKFKKHIDKASDTIKELKTLIDETKSLVDNVSQRKVVDLNQTEENIQKINQMFYAHERDLKEEICETKRRIQIASDVEFDSEIRRLRHVVDDFDMHFDPNPARLDIYKKQLYMHVDELLSENLKSRINTIVGKHVCVFNKAMNEVGAMVLNSDRSQAVNSIVNSQAYTQEDLFDLKIYKQFYTDFQEDLEFRFSLGLVSIIRKFQPNKDIMNTSLDQSGMQSQLSSNTDMLSIVERFMMNPPQSPTTVGSLAVGGILVRTVGWRVIVITTVVYGALYAYEYLTWTNSAKERAFKTQYVRYAKKGLQDCVPIISQHIANSIERDMTTTFVKVKQIVDNERNDLSEKTSLLRQSLDKLKKCDEFTAQLFGESNFLFSEIAAFATSFL